MTPKLHKNSGKLIQLINPTKQDSRTPKMNKSNMPVIIESNETKKQSSLTPKIVLGAKEKKAVKQKTLKGKN